MSGRISQRISAGCVAIGERVRERADAARIEDDDDAPCHSRARFVVGRGMPPVLFAAFVALLAIGAAIPALAVEPTAAPVNQPPPTTTNAQPTPVPTPRFPTYQAF